MQLEEEARRHNPETVCQPLPEQAGELVVGKLSALIADPGCPSTIPDVVCLASSKHTSEAKHIHNALSSIVQLDVGEKSTLPKEGHEVSAGG